VAAFAIIVLIVAHRLLRFDLLSDTVLALRPQGILLSLLALAVPLAMFRKQLSIRFSTVLAVQWLLFVWALITRIVSDGTDQLIPFLTGDYAKDLTFASLIGILATNTQRLRTLIITIVAALLFIAAVSSQQRLGPRECHYFRNAWQLNYEQTSDKRPCQATSDCYTVPPHEQHLRDYGWACERAGPLGLATVVDRVHYTGNLIDPNSLALALVMAAALLIGLATWPNRPGWKWLWLVGLPLLAISVLLAASRAAQAAIGLVTLCFFYFRVGILGAGLAAVLVSPMMLISTRNEAEAAYSTITRIVTYLNGFRAFLSDPFFGVGFANYERISFLNAHNSFLQALVETGVVGGTLYLTGIYVALKLLVQVLRWPPDGLDEDEQHSLLELQHIARTLLAMMLGVLLCVLFLSLAFDFSWLLPLGLVIGFEHHVRQQLPGFQLRIGLVELLALPLLTMMLLGVFILATAR
jgi:hypothetical protein